LNSHLQLLLSPVYDGALASNRVVMALEVLG